MPYLARTMFSIKLLRSQEELLCPRSKMTDEECNEAFETLKQAITDASLEWVTNQVDEEIRFGRTITKTVSSRPDTPEELAVPGLLEKTRQSKVRVSATRPYSPQEKLKILVSGLENVAVETDEMQSAVRTYLTAHVKEWGEVRLLRTDEAGREPLTIASQSDGSRARAVQSLKKLIETLRGMI